MTPSDSDEIHITKLEVQDRDVYIKLIWKQNDNELFHIQVFDGDCSWSGRYSNHFALSFRERDNIVEDEKEYASNVKKCLTGEDENFTFHFTPDVDEVDAASFSWKRRFKSFNVLHGNVPIHRDHHPVSKDTLIDVLLQKNINLKNDIKDLNSKTDHLNGELEKCKDELEKYVEMKTSLETTLYGKFVQLLNAKKKRIQLLEDNLLNFEEPRAAGNELD